MTTREQKLTAGLENQHAASDGDAAVLAVQFDQFHGAKIVELEGATFAVVPQGKTLESLEEFFDERASAPRRQTGTIETRTVDSFLAAVERFKRPDTTVYVDIDAAGAGGLTGVINHPGPDAPAFADWRVVHQLRFSPAWQAWMAASRQAMDQRQFAAFLEDRALDIVEVPAEDALQGVAALLGGRWASASDLITVSRGLQIKIDQEITSAVTLETGAVQVAFAEKHTKAAGAVEVPTLFAIGVPLYEHGAVYRVGVRLRYKVNGGSVSWHVLPMQPERVIEHAASMLAKQVAEACKPWDVQVLRGKLAK
jgi:uncharacterized protein YfdQ (DUF2303 family)